MNKGVFLLWNSFLILMGVRSSDGPSKYIMSIVKLKGKVSKINQLLYIYNLTMHEQRIIYKCCRGTNKQTDRQTEGQTDRQTK